MAVYTFKDGEWRLYDSTPTPRFFKGKFPIEISAVPTGRARPEEMLILDRELFTTLAHYVMGSDRVIAEPLEITIAALLDTAKNYQNFRAALTVGTVGGTVWVTTKGDSSLTSGSGASVTAPAFADASKKALDLQVLWTKSATSVGFRLQEVYFSPHQITVTESMDGVRVEARGLVYGNITEITAFSAGTEDGA